MKHTSKLFEKRLIPVEVATITGHKDTKMLIRYTHLRTEDFVGRMERGEQRGNLVANVSS